VNIICRRVSSTDVLLLLLLLTAGENARDGPNRATSTCSIRSRRQRRMRGWLAMAICLAIVSVQRRIDRSAKST